MNSTRDNAVMHSPDNKLARRRAYRANRREQLALHRDELLRNKVYRFCGWLSIMSLLLIGIGVIGNFFLIGTKLDIVGLIGLTVGPTALTVAITLATALKLAALPIYEYICRERELRSMDDNCALCFIGQPHD